MSVMDLWRVQSYCFPYRSLEAGKWSHEWPWHAMNPARVDFDARYDAMRARPPWWTERES